MEVLAAIGLAGNILTFIDFGCKVIALSTEIYESPSGSSKKGRSYEVVMGEMTRFAAELKPSSDTNLRTGYQAIYNLAAECDSLAAEVLKLFAKVKPSTQGGTSSTIASLRAAFKTKHHESKRRELEERLSQCRSQLALQLNYLNSVEGQAKLDALAQSALGQSEKLDQLKSRLESLSHQVSVEWLSAQTRGQLASLFGMTEQACETIIQRRVLSGLSFEGIHGRYEDVDDAHEKTLHWIYTRGSDSDCAGLGIGSGEVETESITIPWIDPEKSRARELLLDFLASGTGVFHIAGKMGSGKSTLMKYLSDHDSTRSELEQWAGDRKLVIASFFFWNPGSALQKSLSGLYRSLLHDVLKACPVIIKDILPSAWEQAKAAPWQSVEQLHLPDRDVKQGFSRLVSTNSVSKDHCFCFFIDGLDEYEETRQEDARTLVDLITRWTSGPESNVKLCVTSREYNTFMNAFSPNQRIHLQELNRGDIERYCLDKLEHMSHEEAVQLSQSIAKNSSGIFLWVGLVVKRIREQIENEACFDELEREVESLPRELYALFERILDSLCDTEAKRAYQIFSILMEIDRQNMTPKATFNLVMLCFLGEYNDDPNFAMREAFHDRVADGSLLAARRTKAKGQLIGCTKGLLMVAPNVVNPDRHDIAFSHKSVAEFLSSPAQQLRIRRAFGGSSALEALSQVTLGAVWSTTDLRDCEDLDQTAASQGPAGLLRWILSSGFCPSSPWPEGISLPGRFQFAEPSAEQQLRNMGDLQGREDVTLWHCIAVVCLAGTYHGHIRTSLRGHILEEFLEHGADPDIRLSCSVQREPNRRTKSLVTVVTRVKGKHRKLGLKVYQILDEFTEEPLDDLVDMADFENKARIQELIQRNRGLIASTGNDPEAYAQEIESLSAARQGLIWEDTIAKGGSEQLASPIQRRPEGDDPEPHDNSWLVNRSQTMISAAAKGLLCNCYSILGIYLWVALGLALIAVGVGL